ncbi:MAG: putative toxin-antitoxin system toxin component, PIN family [Methylococcaceae bacterium]
MTPHVVLDTNCIISALLFSQQKTTWLRHAWQNEQIIPLAGKDTVNELMRALAYPKFKLGKDQQALLLADFLPYAATVVIDKIPEGLPLIRDKDDQMFSFWRSLARPML